MEEKRIQKEGRGKIKEQKKDKKRWKGREEETKEKEMKGRKHETTKLRGDKNPQNK